MLKISGAFLCIAGCAGYGFLKIIGWKEELKALQQWIFLFQKIKSRIFYQKEPLEESCIWIGEKEKGEWGALLRKIGVLARKNRQKEISLIWREEIEAWGRQNRQLKRVQEILLQFPEYAKEADEELQMNLFSFYLEELNREKVLLERQIQEKQKPVMAVSLIGGIMVSILLL